MRISAAGRPGAPLPTLNLSLLPGPPLAMSAGQMFLRSEPPATSPHPKRRAAGHGGAYMPAILTNPYPAASFSAFTLCM